MRFAAAARRLSIRTLIDIECATHHTTYCVQCYISYSCIIHRNSKTSKITAATNLNTLGGDIINIMFFACCGTRICFSNRNCQSCCSLRRCSFWRCRCGYIRFCKFPCISWMRKKYKKISRWKIPPVIKFLYSVLQVLRVAILLFTVASAYLWDITSFANVLELFFYGKITEGLYEDFYYRVACPAYHRQYYVVLCSMTVVCSVVPKFSRLPQLLHIILPIQWWHIQICVNSLCF